MFQQVNWALIVPMANEEKDFDAFIAALRLSLNTLSSGKVYLIVDGASKDNTLNCCKSLAASDSRFNTIWSPENKNVVDAYLRGYKEAFKNGHEYIIEMDAGLSHDPSLLPVFLKHLLQGVPCVYGSRFTEGGSMNESSFKRKAISSAGTWLANILLDTKLKDMTSGYQGFHRTIVNLFINYPFLSKAHFYQTELRYLLRKHPFIEIPIHYKAPSPSISFKAISNSISTLAYYFLKRIIGRPISL